MLYLQHGGGEDETGWPNQGKTNLIMDNLIAEGKATPFIIVMDNGTWRWPENVPRPRQGERPSGPWPPVGWADEVQFDGANLTSGIYFYKLQTAAQVITRKMTLVKS